MGGTQAAAREEEFQDDVFPWFHLIQRLGATSQG